MATPGWFENLMSNFACHTCDACPSEGQPVEAVKFCRTCRQHLCQECLRMHDTINRGKDHTLVDSDHVEETLNDVSIETCDVHSDASEQRISADEIGKCATENHFAADKPLRKPPRVCDSDEYAHLLKSLHSTAYTLELLLTDRQNDQERLTKQTEEIKRDFKEFRLKWNTHLDELEQDAIEKVNAKHVLMYDDISQTNSQIQTEVKRMKSQHKTLMDGSNTKDTHLHLSMKIANSVVESGKTLLNQMKAKVGKENMYFAFNPVFATALHESKSLGDITDHSFKDVNVREDNDDLTCRISGMCSLEDGSTIIADNSNSALKRLNVCLELVDSLKLPARPFSMCQIDKDRVAVSFPFMYMIQLVSIGTSMTLTTSFQVGASCHGLAFSDGQLYASYPEHGNGRIEIYTTSGQLLRAIPKSETTNRLLISPQALAASYDGSKIFVADHAKGLVILDKNDCIIPIEQPRRLQGGISVCTGGDDQVFVCGYNSHIVCRLSSDGRLKEILSGNDGIRLPCTLHVDRSRTKLLIGMRLSDVIRVYDL